MPFIREMSLFTDELIEHIWLKGTEVPGYDPSKWRKDFAGAWIRHDHYGTRHDYGWEVDHLRPLSHGGTNNIDNLVPLHWRNNIKKGDDTPLFLTDVTSDGNRNIERQRRWQLPQNQ